MGGKLCNSSSQRRRTVKILRTSNPNWCPTNLVSQLKPSNNFCHITIHTCDYCNFLENKVDKYSSFPFLPFFTSLSFPLPVFFSFFPFFSSFLPYFFWKIQCPDNFSVPTAGTSIEVPEVPSPTPLVVVKLLCVNFLPLKSKFHRKENNTM